MFHNHDDDIEPFRHRHGNVNRTTTERTVCQWYITLDMHIPIRSLYFRPDMYDTWYNLLFLFVCLDTSGTDVRLMLWSKVIVANFV